MTGTEQNAPSAVTGDSCVTGVITGERSPLAGWLGRARLTPRAAAASRRPPDWTLIAGPAITLVVMLWGVGARPYWGDEADTVS